MRQGAAPRAALALAGLLLGALVLSPYLVMLLAAVKPASGATSRT